MPISRQVWIGAVLLLLAACSGEKTVHTAPPTQQAVPVAVGTVVRKTVPVEVRAIGNVQPYSTVSVKSRVAGQIIKVGFQEGQEVHKGDLLFRIDPRPYEVALKQGEANQARDEAQAHNAEADAARYEALFKQGIIARQQYEQVRTNAEALRSQVAADEAAIEITRVQLNYTSIRSPIDGRTGNLLVHEGNLVKENDAILVVIHQIQPIYVAFSIPQQFLPEVKRFMAQRTLRARAIPKEGGAAATGDLTFVDNSIDVATGTIQLKATFANQSRSLWPGEFVDVVLDLSAQANALLVPSEAVQTGQQGNYVFVVKADNTAEVRPVMVGRSIEGQTVITSGVAAGETVVSDGQLRLTPGAKVKAR